MKRSLAVAFAAFVALGCGRNANLQKSATHENFGVRMARMNLWREAQFRFQRAVDLDPANATAHNNLAVAYEANGDFEAATREYREAMRLDKSNQYIQKNYSRLVEFQSRNKKRQRRDAAAPAAAGASTPAAQPAVTPPSPAAPPLPATATPPPPTPPSPPPGGKR